MKLTDSYGRSMLASPTSVFSGQARHRVVLNERGIEEERTFIFEPSLPQPRCEAQEAYEAGRAFQRNMDVAPSDSTSDEDDTREVRETRAMVGQRLPATSVSPAESSSDTVGVPDTSPRLELSRRKTTRRSTAPKQQIKPYTLQATREDLPHADAPRWYKTTQRQCGWNARARPRTGEVKPETAEPCDVARRSPPRSPTDSNCQRCEAKAPRVGRSPARRAPSDRTAMRFALPPFDVMSSPAPPVPAMASTPLQRRARSPPSHTGCGAECQVCTGVQHSIARFECLAMEDAESRQDPECASPMGAGESSSDDEDAALRERVRRDPEFVASVPRFRERLILRDGPRDSTVEGATVAKPDVSAPTVADLYRGTTHRDRENLYISVVGGLSFDISREKFRLMIHRVLAPRVGLTLSEETVASIFSCFDLNGGGTVSYFEYLTALCSQLLSPAQRDFLYGLFRQLRTRAEDAERARIREVEGKEPPEESALLKELHRADITHERLRRSVFELLRKSPLFPHPEVKELVEEIDSCFGDLAPSDVLSETNFCLLLFCDDDVMDAVGTQLL